VANFSKVAEEVFQILRSFDYTVEMFDEDSQRVIEPNEARRFFAKPHNLLVSIIDENDDSKINLFFGKSTHASDILGLNTALRQTANKYALIFRAQQYGKEIELKDISTIVSSIVENKQEKNMNVFEKAPPGEKAEHFITKHKAEFKKRYGKKGTEVLYATAWKKFGESVEYDVPLVEGMYGTSKSSYLKLEHARMIVRHSKKIDEKLLGARGRCVENIFIENNSGERFLFPSKRLSPARAMTQHVNNGGSFQDKLGETILEMTESYSHLGKMSGHVKRHSGELQEGAGTVLEACSSKMKKLRKTFECLSREQTYTKESTNILEQANMLSESKPIDETRLSELRQMLNDADLPREVYESACKAMDECKEEQPMVEDDQNMAPSQGTTSSSQNTAPSQGTTTSPSATPPKMTTTYTSYDGTQSFEEPADESSYEPYNGRGGRPPLKFESAIPKQNSVREARNPEYPSGKTVGVLGRRIDAAAWENFAKGKLDLTGDVSQRPAKFDSKLAELCYKLGNVAERTRDISLGNLFYYVTDKLEDYRNGTTSRATREKPDETEVKVHMKKLVQLANHALKAAGTPLSELAENNSVIQEHMSWLDKFDISLLLSEDRWEQMNQQELDADAGADYAIDNFSPEEFIDSEVFKQDIESSHNPDDPEENTITRDEILSSLEYFLRQFIETHYIGDGSAYNSDLNDVARTVYGKVADLLQAKGYIIDGYEGALKEFQNNAPSKPELDMEDILIPKDDMGAGLAGEVTKRVVSNPDSPNDLKKPDDSYIDRLSTLAGLRQGQNY
jgi:hypothetical protein